MANDKLTVEVLSARGLWSSADVLNPCVELRFTGQSFTTSIKENASCPVWNETFYFNVVDKERLPSHSLDAYVCNVIEGSKNFLGKVRLSFPDSLCQANKEYQLRGAIFKRSKGMLRLNVFLTNEDASPTLNHFPHLQSTEQPVTGRQQVDDSLKKLNPKFKDGMIAEQMLYLFVRVVKAQNLPVLHASGRVEPYVKIEVGKLNARTKVVPREQNPEWNKTFAFSKNQLDISQAGRINVVVYDSDMVKDDFVGLVPLNLSDIPELFRTDKPAIPKWHRLVDKSGRSAQGELMLAVWMGSQADDAFVDSWNSDWSKVNETMMTHMRPKVYNIPVLWYLRVHVFEFRCIAVSDGDKTVEMDVTAVVGGQRWKTNPVKKPLAADYIWDEEFTFVAAEPFEDTLEISVEAYLGPGHDKVVVGQTSIPLEAVHRRVNGGPLEIESQWSHLQMPETSVAVADGSEDEHKLHRRSCFPCLTLFSQNKRDHLGTVQQIESNTKQALTLSSCRIRLRNCLEGGYNIPYDSRIYADDLRPAAKEISDPPIVGLLEVGILSAYDLPPRRRRNGRSTLHPYCVAKYGRKWVRTRTITDNCNPSFQEQYSWDVYDTTTVLTIGIFDNEDVEPSLDKDGFSLGKVRIRLSSLQSGRIYCSAYPLLVLRPSGVKRRGHLCLSVRFTAKSFASMVRMYACPKLPELHYEHPLPDSTMSKLEQCAVNTVASRLGLMEPPLTRRVVKYMCESESQLWNLRKSKVNFSRIMSLLSSFITVYRWFQDVASWKNSAITLLVHAVFFLALLFHEFILLSVLLYLFVITVWNYRSRPTFPPHVDLRLSHANTSYPDELDEEFDTFPTSRRPDYVRMRYDRLRSIAGRIQIIMGDIARLGERISALTSWRDPTATVIFGIFTLTAAVILYVTPWKVLVAIAGLYAMRHPRLRGKGPSFILSFFLRLPDKADNLI